MKKESKRKNASKNSDSKNYDSSKESNKEKAANCVECLLRIHEVQSALLKQLSQLVQ